MDHYLAMNRNKAVRHVAMVRLENTVLKADWDGVTCDPNTSETEAGGLRGQPELQSPSLSQRNGGETLQSVN